MTAKQKNRNDGIDKNSHANHDDVARKPSQGDESRGSKSGSWAKVLAVLCYVILAAAAGSAALYLQRVLEEMGQISRRTEASVHKNAELALRLESVLQQVESLRGAVDGFAPAVAAMRAELEAVGGAVRTGEESARRAEAGLRTQQAEMRRELTGALREAEAAQGRDLAERGRALEAELGELMHAVGGSLGLREELAAVAAAADGLRAAQRRAESGTETLRGEVGSLGAELEAANRKAAAAAEEAESARALARSTAAALGESVTAVEQSVQAVSDQTLSLRAGLEEAQRSIQSTEERLQARGERAGEELGVRLGSAEEAVEALRASEATREARLDSLLSRSDSQASALASLGRDLQSARSAGQSEVAAARAALGEEELARDALAGRVEALRSDLGELRGAAAILNTTQAQQSEREFDLSLQLEGLGQRLAELGEAVSEAQASKTRKASVAQQKLQQLMTTVDSLLTFSNRVKGHVDAISSLQSALEETNASVSAMSKKYKVPGGEGVNSAPA